MQLIAVKDYIFQTRVLLQDLVGPPYRYDDDSLLTALNFAMYEIARVRPDILMDFRYRQRIRPTRMLDDNIPEIFDSPTSNDVVPVPPQYKMATLYYMAGYPMLRDTEDTTDARASGFMALFTAAMTGRSIPSGGGGGGG